MTGNQLTPNTDLAEGKDAYAFMEAFDRLFKIFALYPVEHARCTDVADVFRERLDRILRTTSTVNITAGAESLFVQSVELPTKLPALRRFHDILDTLGIAYIEIDSGVSTLDLHTFTSVIMAHRNQAKSSMCFRQFEFEGIPSTIRVVQREFGQRVDQEGGTAKRISEIREAITRSLAALEGVDCNKAKSELYQMVSEKIFSKVIDKLEMATTSQGVSMSSYRSLEDLLNIGVHAIQHVVQEFIDDEEETLDVRGLFRQIKKAVALSDDEESVQLMMDVLMMAADELDVEQSESSNLVLEESGSDKDCVMSLTNLRKRLDECASLAGTISAIELQDFSEELSVMIQLLFYYPTPKLMAGIVAKTDGLLSSRLKPTERQVVFKAIHQLIDRPDYALIDRSLPPIIKSIRISKNESLASFLFNIYETASPKKREAIWPHIVNEILLGFEGDSPEAVNSLHKLMNSTTEKTLKENLDRLEYLEAMREQRFMKRLFNPPIPELYPVFAILLHSSQSSVIGSLLLNGLKSTSHNWEGAEALKLINVYNLQCRDFLARLFAEGWRTKGSDILRDMAGEIILQELPRLSRYRWRENWVSKAILVLGSCWDQRAETLLLKIIKSRKYLFIPVWPKECRNAAIRALKVRRLAKEERGQL